MKITTRFWISLIFSLPMLVEMILKPWGFMLPGGHWTMLALTTVVTVSYTHLTLPTKLEV